MLPEDEVLDSMRDAAYAPLGELEKYAKLTYDDIEHDAEYCQGHISYEVEDASDVSAEQWEKMQKISALFGSVKSGKNTVTGDIRQTIRRHTATCDDCDATETRDSLRIEITVGEITFSREYTI